jgi:hypothetical protein
VPVFFGFGLMPLIALIIIWSLLGPLRPIYPRSKIQIAT